MREHANAWLLTSASVIDNAHTIHMYFRTSNAATYELISLNLPTDAWLQLTSLDRQGKRVAATNDHSVPDVAVLPLHIPAGFSVTNITDQGLPT
jgi:hypothetical protein